MTTFFIDTLELALPISVMIAALLLFSPLIKKSYVAKWRYYMWLFVALRLIFPFRLTTKSAPVTMELPQSISGVPVIPEQAGGISVQSVFMLIWLAGIAVFAVYQVVCYVTYKRRVGRWAVPVTDEALLALYKETGTELGLARVPELMECKAVSTPMIFGFAHTVLLLPEIHLTPDELSVILRHELVHYKRHDIWYKLVLLTANCISWFNPFVYLMTTAANRDIELACDAEVVRGHDMDYRRGYCMAILNVVHNKSQRTVPLSTCFIISPKAVKERFADILNLKKKRKGIVMFMVVALSVAVSGSLVTFATEKAAEVMEEELNIIERPAPKPKVTAAPTEQPAVYAPAVTAAPAARASTTIEEPRVEPIITAEPYREPVYVPARDPETVKAKVDLSSQSSEMGIVFTGEGETYTSQSSFVAENDMNMVIVADGKDAECNVQIVNDATGEVVHEQAVTKENSYVSVPVGSGEYSVNATSTKEGNSGVSLFVYGN